MGLIGKEREESLIQVRTIKVLRNCRHCESNSRDAREAHEILDALQIGLLNRSSLEYLRGGSRCYTRFGILTSISCLIGTRFE